MTYGRTRNHIYKTDIEPNDIVVIIDGEEVLDQSDNLEELCDMFVIVFNNDNDRAIYRWLDGGKQLVKKDRTGYIESIDDLLTTDKSIGNIYGAIWTDKGLIYIAEVVDGQLELL